MNKSFLFPYFFLLCVSALTSCDDFFQPETSDALPGDVYMSSLTEMSTGYLGILTKMQAVGDKEIYLTDTRGEVLEPTDVSIAPLISLYNYDEDLSGNEYADPTPYYDLVIACNDYISKMTGFQKNYPNLVRETDYFDGLLASAIRVKAWVYLTIAEIYGQALWFDDPINSLQDVNNEDIFKPMTAHEVICKCIELLEKPYDCNGLSVSPDADFSWVEWIDPENAAAISASRYRFWDQMTPPYKALLVRLKMWDAAFQDKAGNADAAKVDYEFAASTILEMLNAKFLSNTTYWKRGARVEGNYEKIWNYETPNQEYTVSAIIYDYTKNQTNRLLYHFSNEYPNKYLLRPNQLGIKALRKLDLLKTKDTDKRLELINKDNGGVPFMGKYRPVNSSVRVNAYQDDVHIYTFRSVELYLWLAEALNHLGRYNALEHVLNSGFSSEYTNLFTNIETGAMKDVSASDSINYQGFTHTWVDSKTGGTFLGIRTCMKVSSVKLWSNSGHTDEEAQRHNDELIANEWMLECACEGKSYPNMIRFAERYSDPTIVSTRVSPKYGAQAADIEDKINKINPISGVQGYYVPWKLK